MRISKGLFRSMLLSLLLVFVFLLTSCPTEQEELLSIAMPYRIGERGPAGGIIFYKNYNNFNIDGWRYLEAAPAGWYGTLEDPTFVFGYYGDRHHYNNRSVGTDTAIGTGEANTIALVAAMGDSTYTGFPLDRSWSYETKEYAAKMCADYTGGGFDDWFLPSKDELDLLYTNLKVNDLGGLSYDRYYSSSEAHSYPSSYAWSQNFFYGTQYEDRRYELYKVRPIRAF